MSTIQNFIHAAKDRKAQEIILGPDRPLRFRVGRDLISATDADFSATDSRNFVAQILNEDEKKSLYQDLRVQGIKNLAGVSFKFDFQIDFTGISGSLQLAADLPRAWNFPRNIAESLMRPQGLHILTGPRRSGKSTAVADLISQCKTQNRNIACFVENENQILNLGSLNVSQFPIEQLIKNNIPRSADVIVIDAENPMSCEKALELSEQGYNVLLTLPYWNIQMAMERFLDLSSGSLETNARRLSSVLQWAIGCQLLPGLETTMCSAFELLTVNPEVQNILRAKNIAAISEVMNDKTEKLGMRTMNQSLFQMLMKRKIELKTAFEFSPAPEELDSILKKVGV